MLTESAFSTRALEQGEGRKRMSNEGAWKMVETVLETFRQTEAAGYHTKDREYAIALLSKAVEIRDRPASPQPNTAGSKL